MNQDPNDNELLSTLLAIPSRLIIIIEISMQAN